MDPQYILGVGVFFFSASIQGRETQAPESALAGTPEWLASPTFAVECQERFAALDVALI